MVLDALRGLARAYDLRALDDAPFTPLTLPQLIEEEDEEELDIRFKELSYELPAASWKPIACSGQPITPPRRFIDGTVISRTVAVLTVKRRRRPALLACVGALELDLEDGALVRRTPPRVETVLCLLSNDMPEEHLIQLATGLRGLGIELITSVTEELSPDLELLRRRTFDLASHRMEEAERAMLLARPNVAALVDGLLERRLVTIESQSMPAVGMVKRQVRQYLPNAFVNFLYELAPGERSPAFLLQTKHATIVSWYLAPLSRGTLRSKLWPRPTSGVAAVPRGCVLRFRGSLARDVGALLLGSWTEASRGALLARWHLARTDCASGGRAPRSVASSKSAGRDFPSSTRRVGGRHGG